MYGSRLDPEQGLLVGLFSGSDNSDDDYQRYVDSLLDADRRAVPTVSSLAILFVDRDNPAPDAQWRKRIADATALIRADQALFVLCAESPLIRGVLTAINWIRAPKYETKIVASADAVLALVAERRASALPIARRMLEELRDESRRALPPG